jgi:hypothetical protein
MASDLRVSVNTGIGRDSLARKSEGLWTQSEPGWEAESPVEIVDALDVPITKRAKVTDFNWSPGIGDPTVVGWLTTVLYLICSVSCWILARKLGLATVRTARERRAWRSISVLFLFLGINKQLDLQTALTVAGRMLAHYEGWYEQRQLVQLEFIALIAAMCLISAITLLIWVRDAPISTWLALIGTTLVIGYVLIRAASFHHVNRFFIIGRRVFDFRWNWILEMGGIVFVLLASAWRRSRMRGALSNRAPRAQRALRRPH